jgi:hypothetical protein
MSLKAVMPDQDERKQEILHTLEDENMKHDELFQFWLPTAIGR